MSLLILMGMAWDSMGKGSMGSKDSMENPTDGDQEESHLVYEKTAAMRHMISNGFPTCILQYLGPYKSMYISYI